MEISDHLTCLLQNRYAGQEATTVRTRHGTMDCFKIGKGVWQDCILSPCLLNLYAEYIMWNARLGEAQDGIKIARRNTLANFRYADYTTLMPESEEEIKSLLIKVKEKSKNVGFNLNIQITMLMKSAHHFMADRWGNNGSSEKLYFWGFQKHYRWWQQPWN